MLCHLILDIFLTSEKYTGGSEILRINQVIAKYLIKISTPTGMILIDCEYTTPTLIRAIFFCVDHISPAHCRQGLPWYAYRARTYDRQVYSYNEWR